MQDKLASARPFWYIYSNLHVTKLEIFQVDCPFLSFKNAFNDMISDLGLTFTLNDCKPPVYVWLIQLHTYLIMPAETFQVRSDNPSND